MSDRVARAKVIAAARAIAETYNGYTPTDHPAWFTVNGHHVYVGEREGALIAAVRKLDACGLPDPDNGFAPAVNDAPETSLQAAIAAAPFVGTVRRQVIAAIAIAKDHSLIGYTCEQLEERLGRPHTTVSSAVNWARDAGWIEDSGVRRKTRAKRQAVVWTVTPAAQRTMRQGGWM